MTPDEIQMIQILDETIQYYSEDPIGRRAFHEPRPKQIQCVYQTPDGKKCAIGRLLAPSDLENLKKKNILFQAIENVYEEIKTPIIQQFPIEFWEKLQAFHDGDIYWDLTKNTISKEGEKFTQRLRNQIQSGQFSTQKKCPLINQDPINQKPNLNQKKKEINPNATQN